MFTLVLLILGCAPDPERSELVGAYGFDDGTARERLTLTPDGYYVLEWEQGGVRRTMQSTWSFRHEDCPRLTLRNYPTQPRALPSERHRGTIWSTCVERDWRGYVTIVVDPDLGTSFHRIEDQ